MIQCACCSQRFEPKNEDVYICSGCDDHQQCCGPNTIEVTREEWDRLTPGQAEQRNISIIREPNGYRRAVPARFRIRRQPIH